jgi:hypothetical protein
VVVVTVDAGRREDLCQPVQELEGRETERGAAGQVGPREEVEDLVGTVADQVESVEGERRPSTMPDEPLEAGAVGSLDTDAGVEAEPATVIPAEHVLGVVGLQEAVAAEPSGLGGDGAERSEKHPARPSNEAKLSSMKCLRTLERIVCWRPSSSSWVRAVASWKRRLVSGLAGS